MMVVYWEIQTITIIVAVKDKIKGQFFNCPFIMSAYFINLQNFYIN